MTESVIIAAISFLGTMVGSLSGLKLVNYRITQLEEKVNKHNQVIQRTYILEEQMKVANHRIDDLERHEEEKS